MELKDVTKETKIEECDFFSQRTKNECRMRDVETIGQLLNIPVGKIEHWHGWKPENEIKLFLAEYKNTSNLYEIETRMIAGETYIKIHSLLGKCFFNRDFVEQDNIWINSNRINGFFEGYHCGMKCLMCNFGDMVSCTGIVKPLE